MTRARKASGALASALRSILFLLFQVLVTPCYAVAMLAFAWLPRVPRYNMARSWCRVNLWGIRWICGIRWRVIGAGNIPTTPHVVMSKHSSTWETLALNLYFPPLAFVAKKELLSIPFFGWGFALASPITIDRSAGKDAMELMAAQGRERFRQGFWIVVYPEGTRIRVGRRARYKTGGARLAQALPAPILPVAHNAGYLWPKGLLGKKPGTITLSIGPSIAPDGKDTAQLTKEVEDWIEGEVARLGTPE
jgi:1-acyl-sn-glycerol-3-phosphate acyltransferase